ncbi:hypothetical protein [Nannocystis pusilla]|uniref:hypothetical protein n=1 Tax=Nannocystis pusilla TaxID=889268 RepID=UPI003BF38845
MFDVSYAETARTLQMDEVGCRKLVSRARGHVEQARVRHVTPRERQEELLAAFEAAVVGGHTGRLAALLAGDVELQVDSGGKVAALRDTLRGREAVLAFVRDTLHRVGGTLVWEAPDLNGARAGPAGPGRQHARRRLVRLR